MSTRTERQALLVNKAAHRIRGLAEDPLLGGFLDELDRADSEGLNQLVEQLLAEVSRSGTLGGFGLELAIANVAMDVPAPRRVRCEQKEGLCKVPGDLWIDSGDTRYEFQCKRSLNWIAELPLNDAMDRIADSTKNDSPGYLYGLAPEAAGDRTSWLAFADWVIANYRSWAVGEEHVFEHLGQRLGKISLIQERNVPGLVAGQFASPDFQVTNVEKLKKKLRLGSSKALRSISAPASASQMNCLVVDYENPLVGLGDIFEALYGHIEYRINGLNLQPNPVWDGLFYAGKLNLWSAVAFVKFKEFNPFSAKATLFPNPLWFEEVERAFADFPRTRIVRSTTDVDL